MSISVYVIASGPQRIARVLYIGESALQHLRQQGVQVRPEDIERLSPLGHIHINMLGRFFFDLPESAQLGAMRSLRILSNLNDNICLE
ncbi:MAG: Tn3 family transposase [Phormidesmis sp.]